MMTDEFTSQQEDSHTSEARKLNILFLSQYYAPEGSNGMPATVCQGLKQRGHNVKVLTTFPHYSHGKVSHGYKQRLRFSETLDGIEVRRVPIYARHTKNPISRIANYLSFAYSARTAKDFVKGADVVYVWGTPATVAEPARAWFKSLGIPFVFHVLDIWPESVTESGFLPRKIASRMEGIISKWLQRVYASAAAVVAIAPSARTMLIERGAPEERTHLVYNWSGDSDVLPSTPEAGLTVLYAGNLGQFQDLETVIRAANELSHLPDFRLKIAGGGILEEQLKQLVSDIGADETVEFLGKLPRDQMNQVYASAHYQVVSLKDINIFSATIPSKFQGGLAHGVPVITTVKGDVSSLVRNNGLGFAASPENVEELAEAFLAAYNTSQEERDAMAVRARRFYLENFTAKIAVDRLETILIDAAETRSEEQR